MTAERTQGLNCPSCGGIVLVREGVRIVQCPFCDQRSLVQGEKGVRRWQVRRKVGREDATKSVRGFLSGPKKALDLKRKARVREVFAVYLPFWHVLSFVSGWLFGRVKVGKNSTKPAEVEIAEEMQWIDAAVDVSEFGVQSVSIHERDLEPLDADRLHSEAMVFEPTESRTEALAEAEEHFRDRCRRKSRLETTLFDKLHALRTQFSLVYYPLWIARYEYHSRSYQVVVDGVNGQVLYGKAPGNILFRAAALVAAMAVGTFILVDGTLVALPLVASDGDDCMALLALPVAVGAGLILAGYRAFRYGGEVEKTQTGPKKSVFTADLDAVDELVSEILG